MSFTNCLHNSQSIMAKTIAQTVGEFRISLINRMSEAHLHFINAKLQAVYSPLEWRWHRLFMKFIKEQMNQQNHSIEYQYALNTSCGLLSEQFTLRPSGYLHGILNIIHIRRDTPQEHRVESELVDYNVACNRLVDTLGNSKYCHSLFKDELSKFCWEMCQELQQSYAYEVKTSEELASFGLSAWTADRKGSIHVWSQSEAMMEEKECENSIRLTGRTHYHSHTPVQSLQ